MTPTILDRPATPRGVEAVPRRGPDGAWCWHYRTRWTDPLTGRRIPAVFETVDDVLDFRARLRIASARGEVARLSRGDRTLHEFVERDYWPRYARRHLARNTLAPYRSVYRRHIDPHLGPIRLRRLSAPIVFDYAELLQEAGVGAPTVRRALMLLQGICRRAVAVGEMDGNPVREIDKPAVTRQLAIDPPGARQIEALRRELDPAGAALVSLIGYEGLRPSEALALEQRHLRDATLLIEQHLDHGAIVIGQKIGRRKARSHRNPRLYPAVRADVDAHLADLGRRGRRRLLFPSADGDPWTVAEYRRWREQTFAPAVGRAGIELARPYDLRHGCASMLLHAGRPLREIGEHLGHSVATLSAYYSHLIADLRDSDPIAVETQITDARLTARLTAPPGGTP